MPLGESFLATIKSNKSIMLDKSRRFRKTSGGFNWSKSPQLDLPKSTPEQLEEIRIRIQLENKKAKLKELILATLIAVVLMLEVVYIMF